MNNAEEWRLGLMAEVKVITDMNSLLMYGSNFCLVYLMSVAGSITREVYAYKKDSGQTFRISKILLSALLSTVVMLAIIEYVDLPFPVLGMICYFFGMWGYHLINLILQAKYVAIFIKDILKELGNPILKGTANAIDEIRKEADADKKEEKNKKDEDIKNTKTRKNSKKQQKTSSLTQNKPLSDMTVEDKHAVVNKVYGNFSSMDEQILRNKIRSIGDNDKNNKAQ